LRIEGEYVIQMEVSKVVSDIKGGTQAQGVTEQGAEEDIWSEEG
jgi:hypothetical protein